jgi:hypothetical protein
VSAVTAVPAATTAVTVGCNELAAQHTNSSSRVAVPVRAIKSVYRAARGVNFVTRTQQQRRAKALATAGNAAMHVEVCSR